jgi:hypothetical protein
MGVTGGTGRGAVVPSDACFRQELARVRILVKDEGDESPGLAPVMTECRACAARTEGGCHGVKGKTSEAMPRNKSPAISHKSPSRVDWNRLRNSPAQMISRTICMMSSL